VQRSQVARAWQAGAQHRVARQAQVQGSRWGKKARQDRSAVLGKACAEQGGMAGAGVGPNSPFQSECRRNGSRDQGADGHTSRKLFWRVYTNKMSWRGLLCRKGGYYSVTPCFLG